MHARHYSILHFTHDYPTISQPKNALRFARFVEMNIRGSAAFYGQHNEHQYLPVATIDWAETQHH